MRVRCQQSCTQRPQVPRYSREARAELLLSPWIDPLCGPHRSKCLKFFAEHDHFASGLDALRSSLPSHRPPRSDVDVLCGCYGQVSCWSGVRHSYRWAAMRQRNTCSLPVSITRLLTSNCDVPEVFVVNSSERCVYQDGGRFVWFFCCAS